LISTLGIEVLPVRTTIPLRQFFSRYPVLVTALTVVVVFLAETALVVIARGTETSNVEEAGVVLYVADGRVRTGSGVAFAGIVCGRVSMLACTRNA